MPKLQLKNAYEILHVAKDADDTAIREAYLAAVKIHPPGQEPEEFQIIREAYENIQNAEARLNYDLFQFNPLNMHQLLETLMASNGTERVIPEEHFLSMIKEQLKHPPEEVPS